MTVEELYRLHSARIYRYALRCLADEQDAEDIVQSTFMLAQANLTTLLTHEKPGAWLTVTARNLIRRKWDAAGRETPLDDTLPDIRPDALWELLPTDLSELDRQIAEMLITYKLSHREIAETLGIHSEACNSKVRRLKLRIKKEFAKSVESWQNVDKGVKI